MCKIKVLPLTFPFSCEKGYWDNCVEEKNRITPVFNRNGYYLDRMTKKTWLEINGEAWIYSDKEYFDYNLAVSEGNNWMEDRCYNALQIVLENGLGNTKLREIFTTACDRRRLKEIGRTSGKAGIGFRKRFKEFKEKLDNAKASKRIKP